LGDHTCRTVVKTPSVPIVVTLGWLGSDGPPRGLKYGEGLFKVNQHNYS